MKKVVTAAVAAGLLFAVTSAAASTLDLSGSDPAPGSGRTPAACAGTLVVTYKIVPLLNEVTEVRIDGDMTRCQGSQVLVQIEAPSDAWAVHTINNATTEHITLTLSSLSGDFYDEQPNVVDGRLVPDGSRVLPKLLSAIDNVSVSVARTWE